MAELRLNGEMNLLSTRYRVSSDCACRFKRQKWMVEVLRETSSDIGRIGLTGEKRELLFYNKSLGDLNVEKFTHQHPRRVDGVDDVGHAYPHSSRHLCDVEIARKLDWRLYKRL